MKKSEVTKESLSNFVIMPDGIDIAFNKWWVSMDASALVRVRYPHERHGNAGRPSNFAKQDVRKDFLRFVDSNTQPNGRSADSSGPTFYFSPKFTTIQSPIPTVHHFEERVTCSVVGEFNRVQREEGKGECSNGSSHNWLKKFRPKVAICPHQEDYCDTCSKFIADVNAKQTVINRLQHASQSSPEEVQKEQSDLEELNQQHENHKQAAQASHTYYTTLIKRCSEQWSEIATLEEKQALSEEEKEHLISLKSQFTLVICADYQMAKLVPYWGQAAQPGSTYYLQKLSHDIFGIVDHGSGSSKVYLFDERAGLKNTDHTILYLTHYISSLPSWIHRVHIFLDNTCSTNKNYYLMSWAYKVIQQDKLNFLRVSFLIAGHTKFSPDLLFSKIAQSYNKSDVFNTNKLKNVIANYASVILDNGALVGDWREKLSKKYSKLPGIRELHDYIYVKNPVIQQFWLKFESFATLANSRTLPVTY